MRISSRITDLLWWPAKSVGSLVNDGETGYNSAGGPLGTGGFIGRVAGVEKDFITTPGMLLGKRTVAGVVNTSGSGSIVASSNDFTITRNGVGNLTVTYKSPFVQRPSVAFGSVDDSGIGHWRVTYHRVADAATGFTIQLVNIDVSAAVDGIFHFTATATDNEAQGQGVGAMPGVRVYPATTNSRTLTTGQDTDAAGALVFDAEVFDNLGEHDTVTNNGRLTAATAGPRIITATVTLTANLTSTGTVRCFIKIVRAAGGTEYHGFGVINIGESGTSMAAGLEMNVGDYAEVRVINNNANSIIVAGGALSSGPTSFGMLKTGQAWVLDKPYFRASRTAALTQVVNNTVVIFSNEETDPNGWYDPTTGKFQPTVPGQYRIRWRVGLGVAITADKFFHARLYKNAAMVRSGSEFIQRGTAAFPLSGNDGTLVAMNGSTDFCDVRAATDDGTPGTTTYVHQADAGYTYFEAEFVGPQ